MSKICGECINFDRSLSKCNKMQDDNIRATDTVLCCPFYELKPPTLFDRITASPEVLAEKLVYPTYGIISRSWDFEKDDWGTAEPSWSSTALPPDPCFSTKEEAIAATVARLKEIVK